MLEVKLTIIIYRPGACGDFLAGWLGTLPNHVNSNWSIDPITGKSTGKMSVLKRLGKQNTLENLLLPFDIKLSKSSNLTWACTNHESDKSALEYVQKNNQANLVYIDHSTANQEDLIWNYYVKMFLSQDRSLFNIKTDSIWYVDSFINQSLISNIDRINYVKSKLISSQEHMFDQLDNLEGSTILDFSKTFVPGGYNYLKEKLHINVPKRNAAYWDSQLDFIQSPDELTVWGHTWRRKDFSSYWTINQ